MQDMDQPLMVAGDGFILENALNPKLKERPSSKILPPYDFDGAPRPGQICQPYFSVRRSLIWRTTPWSGMEEGRTTG